MDRSFLSDADVVAASRKFVCIRVATYEDQEEADFAKSLFVGRSGQLENTTFAILDPAAKRKLTAAGRGPFHAFRGASEMAAGMKKIAVRYPATWRTAFAGSRLPKMKSFAIGLNVAAAEGLPLIVTRGDAASRKRLETQLNRIVWKEPFQGQFVFATATNPGELKSLTGVEQDARLLVAQPGQFGVSGKVLKQFSDAERPADIESALKEVIAKFPRRYKDHRDHVRQGIRLGIDWQSAIPETDPQSVRARQQARGRR